MGILRVYWEEGGQVLAGNKASSCRCVNWLFFTQCIYAQLLFPNSHKSFYKYMALLN